MVTVSKEFFNVPRDPNRIKVIKEILEQASSDDILKFLDGLMNVMVVAEVVLQRKFPNEHAKWVTKYE